jgi:hypothetical protein
MLLHLIKLIMLTVHSHLTMHCGLIMLRIDVDHASTPHFDNALKVAHAMHLQQI